MAKRNAVVNVTLINQFLSHQGLEKHVGKALTKALRASGYNPKSYLDKKFGCVVATTNTQKGKCELLPRSKWKDAIQINEAARVPLCEAPGDSKAVGEGNSKEQEATNV